MRNFLLVIAIAGMAFAISCTNAAQPPVRVENTATPAPAKPPAQPGHEDDGHDSPRISLADAKKEFDAGTAVFVDTHAKEQYDNQHIKGAINIPANDIGDKFSTIPKGKKIIAYCT